MSSLLTVAMPKGRIFQEAVELLRQAGYPLPPEFEDSRKLIIEIVEAGMRFILAKPMDVPTYVEHGVADVGIAGKDVMLEEERDVYEVLDLKISDCYLAVAGLPEQRSIPSHRKSQRNIRMWQPTISGNKGNRWKSLN